MTPDQRAAVVAAARGWLQTPFHHGACVRGVGVDCLQLLIGVYGGLGLIPAIDPGPYPWDWHMHKDEERYLNGVAQVSGECFGFGRQGGVRCMTHDLGLCLI